MKIQWANRTLLLKLPRLPPVEVQESSTHLAKPRARPGGRKKAMPKSRANARHASSLPTQSRKPGASSRFKAPSQTQAFCFILKAFVKAGAPSCAVGYLKLCSAERGRVIKSGIEAELGGCVCVCACVRAPHPSASRDGRGSRPAGSLSFAQPATDTLEFVLSQPQILYAPRHGVMN